MAVPVLGSPCDLTAVVLAGGQSRRMGGQDKGLLELAGQSLVERVLGRISPVARECLVSANRHLDVYGGLGYPVLTDHGRGPLDGLLAAMRRATQPWVLMLPCDMPFYPVDMPQQLLAAAQYQDAVAAFPISGQQTHQAIMLCRCDWQDHLSAYLERGGRKVLGWLDTVVTVQVVFAHEVDFLNINTPEDWQQAEQRF